MPLEDVEYVRQPLDLADTEADRVDDPFTAFWLSNPVSWPTELLSGELSALCTTLVFPWTASLKLHIELQEDPSFEYPLTFFAAGSCTFNPSICLQVSKFLIWSHEDGCFSFCFCNFCCFLFRFDGAAAAAAGCFLDSVGSGKKVSRAMKSKANK